MEQETCPFDFNFNPDTFKPGDTVSYRVPSLGDFPFVGRVVSVSATQIELVDQGEPGPVLRASRCSRPVLLDETPLQLAPSS